MNRQRSFLWVASAALAAILVLVFFKVSKLDFQSTLEKLRRVSWVSFAMLTALTTLHVFLSSLKWRCVDARLRSATDFVPSKLASFALTSMGVVLGQLLPVQISMSIARTLGTYFEGRAIRRGAGGTIFEQIFDVLIVVFFAIASMLALLLDGGARLWLGCATLMSCMALFAVGPAVNLVSKIVKRLEPKYKVVRIITGLERSGLLEPRLARQLMGLSLARFIVQVLMAGVTAKAVGADIPVWRLAATIPFVTLACVIVMTPASLGINELSYATTLHLFGTPLQVGAQWALVNRFLVLSACAVIAAGAMGCMGIARTRTRGDAMNILQEEHLRSSCEK